MSTPGIALKRKIAQRFQVYSLDEFRTSCLNNKTEERCHNTTSKIKLESGVKSIQFSHIQMGNEKGMRIATAIQF